MISWQSCARHGALTARLTTFATLYVLEHDLGECFAAETGFLVAQNPETVLAPDWAFVAHERMPGVVLDRYFPGVPDIVLETRSPYDTGPEVAKKVQEWLAAGVRTVWEMNPKTQILTVHRADRQPVCLDKHDMLDAEAALPGFTLPLSRVFRETV